MNKISDLQFTSNQNAISSTQKKEANSTSFKETLGNLLHEVDDLQQESKQSVEKFINGEISDVHQVMIAAEKANVGLELTLAIRNKLLDAYREIMRMHG